MVGSEVVAKYPKPIIKTENSKKEMNTRRVRSFRSDSLNCGAVPLFMPTTPLRANTLKKDSA